jgi:hypothetical protein
MNAILRIQETVGGEYGYHEKTGAVNQFDASDIPTWKFWLVYAVEIEIVGIVKWGPYTTRVGAKKRHSGQAKVKFVATEFYDHRNSPKGGNAYHEACARREEIKEMLFKNGFDVTTENWERRYIDEHNELKNPLTRRAVEFIADPPPRQFQKRVKEKVFMENIFPDR